MPNIEELQLELESLKADFERFKGHQHLGVDGSREFSDNTKFRGRELSLSGAGTPRNGFVAIPLTVADATTQQNSRKRINGVGIAVTGTKDTSDENIVGFYEAGKDVDLSELANPPNKTDWTKVNYVDVKLVQVPQSVYSSSGPTLLPPLSFVKATRTPEPTGTGTITLGGNTLTDSNASFATDALVLGVINIFNSSGTFLESRRITGNTSTVITIDNYPYSGAGVWTTASGSYLYLVSMPVLLGDAQMPFARLYVGDDIRLGYGTSSGADTLYIKWGAGTPEAVVTANPGSMFLSTNGNIYRKSSGTGNTGWTAM